MSTGAPSGQQPAAPVRFRRNAELLTNGQQKTLRGAFANLYEIPDDRGYEYFAGIHGLPMPISCENAHGTPYFLPWHRAYLYFFERALRDRAPNAGLVWWDWQTGPGIASRLPEPYRKATVGGKPNPLYSAKVSKLAIDQGKAGGVIVSAKTKREPDDLTELPSAEEVEDVLSRRQFKDFSGALEQLHGRVHDWVGGHMGMIPFAAFDPVFWAHHTMCDRIWRLWQLRNPGGGPPASLLDEALPPFRMTVRQTLSVTALGYDYAASTAAASVGARAASRSTAAAGASR
jgi:tyrosinase